MPDPVAPMGATTPPGVSAAAYAHLRADALAQLSAWEPPDADQESLRAAYLAHLQEHPDAVAKAGPPEHLTASVLVIDPTGSAVLLTHHRKADAWYQFGGHLEPADSSLAGAARREGREESGIPDLELVTGIVQLDRHALVGAFGRCREHLDVRYVAVASPVSQYAASAESLDVRWVDIDELPRVAPTVVSLAGAARAVLGLGAGRAPA